jgi:hypothetical protein
MSGGSEEHSLLAGNVIREIGNAVSDRGCRVLTSDMRGAGSAAGLPSLDRGVSFARFFRRGRVHSAACHPGLEEALAVKHYMQYHNAEKMGYGCAGIEEELLSIETQKSVPDITGEVVWILCGEGKPRRYGLCARFVVTDIDSEPGGKTIVSGEGTLLKREIPLNDEPWFKGFLEDYQNFSLGFREIRERKYIEHFERLLAAGSAGKRKAPQGSSRAAESKQSPRAAKKKTSQRSSARALLSVASAAHEEKSPARGGNVGPAKDGPVELFIAYSHKDEEWRKALDPSLKIMERSGHIKRWHDREIAPGDDWRKEIDKNLSRAQIILLLISRDFLASDYCHDIELQKAMKRHDAGDAVVIPIIFRSCQWQDTQLGRLQALPRDSKPVRDWSDEDAAFLDIEQGIRLVIDKLRGGSRLT